MSLSRSSAGSGYRYLLRHTACADARRPAGTPLTAYYAADGYPPGRWLGAGLAGLGNGCGLGTGVVAEEAMAAVFGAAADPVTGGPLGRHHQTPTPLAERVAARVAALPVGLPEPERAAAVAGVEAQERARRVAQPVAGFDLTFTVPKSVSVLWALADAPVQAAIAAAHQATVADVLTVVEQEALFTRTGARGAAQVPTRGAVAAAFDHCDSRAGDPNLHTHLVLANRVQGPDGKWRTIDGKALYAAAVALSELYDILLADRLTQVLGVGWEVRDRGPRRTPAHEIVGVDDALLREFSARSADITVRTSDLVAAFTAERGREPGRAEVLRLRQQATLQTLPTKTLRPLAELVDGWRARAEHVAGPRQRLLARVLPAARRLPEPLPSPRPGTVDMEAAERLELSEVAVDDLARNVIAGVQARRATWTEWNLRAEAARTTRHLRIPDTQARLALLDRIVAVARDVHSVALDPPALVDVPDGWRRPDGTSVFTRSRESAYTSTTLLDAEQRLLTAAADDTAPRTLATPTAGLPEPLPHTSLTTGERLPTAGHGLAEDQAAAVTALAGSGRRVDVLVGPAGAGKTTTLRALRAVWEAAHGPGSVLGLAPSAAAARALSAGLGVPAETAAKWDHETRGKGGAEEWALRAGQLVVVDEAALAGTLLLDRLVDAAGQAGAKVVLVGDHGQLSAVDAGGAFGLLARHGTPIELGTLHRFSAAWEAEASRRLRAGDPRAVDAYTAHGRITDGPAEAMTEAAYRAWRTAQQAGQTALLIAADTATVTALNTRARADRLAARQLSGPGVRLHDGTQAAAGDLVLTRRNDRRLRARDERGRGRGGRRGFVRNGDRWTITAVHPDGALTVTNDRGGGELRLPAEYVAAHVELGYATTAHRAQGATVDAAYAILRPGMARETAYVALTRGRHINRAFVYH